MSLQTPLGRFLGHGSAKDGTAHWWAQKLTAVGLIPLTLWFAVAIATMDGYGYAATLAFVADPLNAILLILLVIAGLYHSELGLQVVVEDYVHGWPKIVTLTLFKLAHVALGVAAIYSIISISAGSS